MCGIQIQKTAVYAASGAVYASSGACAAHLLSNSALSVTAGALAGAAGGIAGALVSLTVMNMWNTAQTPEEAETYTKAKLLHILALQTFASFLVSTGLLHLAKAHMASKSIVLFSAMTSGIAIGMVAVVALVGMSLLLGLVLSGLNNHSH